MISPHHHHCAGSNSNGSSPGLAEIGCHAGHWFDPDYHQDHIHDDKDGDQDDQVEVSLKCLKVFYTRSGVDVADKYMIFSFTRFI